MSQQQQPHQMVKATEREGERENLLIAVIIVGPRSKSSKSLYCIIPMPQFIMSPSLLLCGPLQYCNHSRKESLIELDVTHVYMFLLSSPFSAHLVGCRRPWRAWCGAAVMQWVSVIMGNRTRGTSHGVRRSSRWNGGEAQWLWLIEFNVIGNDYCERIMIWEEE